MPGRPRSGPRRSPSGGRCCSPAWSAGRTRATSACTTPAATPSTGWKVVLDRAPRVRIECAVQWRATLELFQIRAPARATRPTARACHPSRGGRRRRRSRDRPAPAASRAEVRPPCPRRRPRRRRPPASASPPAGRSARPFGIVSGRAARWARRLRPSAGARSKRAPPTGASSTVTVPPWRSPPPAPGRGRARRRRRSRARPSSRRVKRSNTRSRSAAAMPGPSSSTRSAAPGRRPRSDDRRRWTGVARRVVDQVARRARSSWRRDHRDPRRRHAVGPHR